MLCRDLDSIRKNYLLKYPLEIPVSITQRSGSNSESTVLALPADASQVEFAKIIAIPAARNAMMVVFRNVAVRVGQKSEMISH